VEDVAGISGVNQDRLRDKLKLNFTFKFVRHWSEYRKRNRSEI